MRTEAELAEHGAAAEARRLLDAARAEAGHGSYDAAWALSRGAAAIGRRLDDAEVIAEAAIVLSEPELLSWTSAAERQALCVEALRMLDATGRTGRGEPQHAALRARVAAQLATLSTGWAERVEPGPGAIPVEAALARFDRIRVDHARAGGPGAPGLRLELADAAVSIGVAAAVDEPLAWGRMWRVDSLLQLGRRLEFNAALGEFRGLVERMGSPVWQWRLASVHAMLALLEDRLEDLPAAVEAARAAGRASGVAGAGFYDLILRAHIAQRTLERLDAVEAEVRLAIVDAPLFAQGWRALLLLDLGRTDEAVGIWQALAPHVDELPPEADEWLVATVGHAALAIAADDRAGAARVLDLLLPFAGLHVVGPATTPYGGPVSLVLSRLAGYLGDRAAQAAWAEDALVQSERLGAKWYAQQARALLGPERALAPLSPRESEVAHLVSEGRSNRAIAEELFLSERTVEQHVRSILRKLALPNRAAVAGWVIRRRR